MRSVLLFSLLMAAAIVRIGAEASKRPGGRPPKPGDRERQDLSAEGTASDYPKQFGIVHPGSFAAGHWHPYHSHHSSYRERYPVDPFVGYLFARYARFLPQGLGLYGIYGSTGLPSGKPPGVFSFPQKDI